MEKCKHCKKKIEDWASDTVDEEGNKYCMDCTTKAVAFMEMQEEGEQ